MVSIKTAVSIDESLFERAEALAKEMEIPRSQIFAIALEEFLKRHDAGKLLARLNTVFAETPTEDQEELRLKRAKHRKIVEGTW